MQNNHVERTLPLSSLRLSPKNVRKTKSTAESIASMAASLLANGQMQNLVVYEAEPGVFEVAAGERRFCGFSLLVEEGKIKADQPVRTLVISAEEATSASTIENIEREQMTPADQFDAFAALAAEGKTVDEIADMFSVTPLVVERRLRLANAHPELLDLFRKGEISTDQLIALCATSDQDRQLSVWQNAGMYDRHANVLRKRILADEFDLTNDKRLTYIGGVEAFEAAGGQVRRDIFSQAGSPGLTKDGDLLDRLVCEKLDVIAAPIQNEGWAWVEVHPDVASVDMHRFGRLEITPAPLPEEQQARFDDLERKRDEASEAVNAHWSNQADDDDEQAWSDQLEKLEAVVEELDDQLAAFEEYQTENGTYPADAKAYAGVIVGLKNGEVVIERGLVKPEDRKAAKKATPVAGGRETVSAGRKENAISDALRRNLLGQRNIAAQIEVAKNPKVAKVLAVMWMVKDLDLGINEVPTDLSFRDGYNGTRTQHPVDGDHAKGLADRFKQLVNESLGKFSKTKNLWDVLMGMDDAALDALLAVGIARSVSLRIEHKGETATLLDALDFDMANHFAPTAESYFGRVTKVLVVEALKEVGKAKDADQLLAMKRGDLAALAEQRMQGERWVPEPIRGPKRKAKAEGGTNTKQPAAKKTASKKATNKKPDAPKKAAPAKKAAKAAKGK